MIREMDDKTTVFGRFSHDPDGRLVVRLKTIQIVLSSAVAVVVLVGAMLTAVAVLAEPYLATVVKKQTASIERDIDKIPSIYQTRLENETEMLELNRKLDYIAGQLQAIDGRVGRQSERTDALYRDILQALRDL